MAHHIEFFLAFFFHVYPKSNSGQQHRLSNMKIFLHLYIQFDQGRSKIKSYNFIFFSNHPEVPIFEMGFSLSMCILLEKYYEIGSGLMISFIIYIFLEKIFFIFEITYSGSKLKSQFSFWETFPARDNSLSLWFSSREALLVSGSTFTSTRTLREYI